jgi:Uma2 family endonuclease
MSTLIQDEGLERLVIEERRRKGLDRPDETWEGTYVIMPNPNDEHQQLVMHLSMRLCQLIEETGLGQVRPGVNISDRIVDWRFNFRCPDVVVFLNDTAAECHDTFWYGGPDFAIEIVSPNDRTRDKLEFYASVRTRELLVIDRDPWSLELYRLIDSEMQLVGRCTPESRESLGSEVLPLKWSLAAATGSANRPRIELRHTDGQTWMI